MKHTNHTSIIATGLRWLRCAYKPKPIVTPADLIQAGYITASQAGHSLALKAVLTACPDAHIKKVI